MKKIERIEALEREIESLRAEIRSLRMLVAVRPVEKVPLNPYPQPHPYFNPQPFPHITPHYDYTPGTILCKG